MYSSRTGSYRKNKQFGEGSNTPRFLWIITRRNFRRSRRVVPLSEFKNPLCWTLWGPHCFGWMSRHNILRNFLKNHLRIINVYYVEPTLSDAVSGAHPLSFLFSPSTHFGSHKRSVKSENVNLRLRKLDVHLTLRRAICWRCGSYSSHCYLRLHFRLQKTNLVHHTNM